MKKYWVLGISLMFLICSQFANAQTTLITTDKNIYLNPASGSDTNSGTTKSPLKTLSEAAKRINASEGEGAITIYLSAGIYSMGETTDLNPKNWKLTQTNRLLIRAEKLPDDADWTPADMPIIISAMPFSVEKNDKGEVTGWQNFGFLIQVSHVTLQGLRVLGEPVHENPSKGILVRNYPIVWEGKNLEDLKITQCLFLGSRYAIPNHLAVLANGKALEVNHCVFYGVKDAVVMWNSPATQSSFHHNLVIDSYGGLVWTWAAQEDFKFYNNVVSNANVLWVLDKDEKLSYTIDNSVIVGYASIVNKGGGAQGFGEKANPVKLKLNKNVTLKKSGKLQIIEDQISRNYLHIKPGTLGSHLKAGLFTK
jgi:hypothetical protein